MRTLARAELWGFTHLVEDNGRGSDVLTALRVLDPLIRCETRYRFDGRIASAELTVEIPRDVYENIPDGLTTLSVYGAVRSVMPGGVGDLVRLVYADDDYDEFRVAETRVVVGESQENVLLTCRGMIYELAEREKVISQRIGGRVSYSVVKRDTVTNLFTYVLGFAPSKFSLGTVTAASLNIEVTLSGPPLQGLTAIVDRIAQVTGIEYELSARRDGSGYKIDCTVLNSGAAPADIRTGKNLKSLTRIHTVREEGTRIVPLGPTGVGVGDNAYKVVIVGTSPTRIEVEAPQGGPGAIWLDLPGDGLVVLDKAGGTHTVTAANEVAVTGDNGPVKARASLQMASTTGIAVGDWIRLVRNTSLDEIEHVDGIGFTALGAPGLDPVLRVLQLPYPEHTNWIKNPTLLDWVDGAPTDWTKTIGGTSRTTANQGTAKGWTDPDGSSNGLNTLTLDSANTNLTVAAGSRLYNIVGDPTAGSNVDAADDNYTLTFKVKADRGDLMGGPGGSLERTVTANVTIEYSTDGGTNWNPLTGTYSVNSGDTSAEATYSPTVQVTGSPTQLRFRLILQAQTSGGVTSGSGTATVQVFDTTWLTNTYAVTWTTGGAAPAEDTTAGKWLTGGRSAKFTSGQCFLTGTHTIYFPRTGWVTYSAWIFVEAKGSGGVSTIRFKNPQTGANTDIALDSDSQIVTGQWLKVSRSFEITSVGQKTLECRFGNSTSVNAGTWWVDAAQFSFTESDVELVVGSGGAQLIGQANRYLALNYQPLYEYEATFADLTRLDAATWPYDELLLGATVNITDEDLGIEAAQRIVGIVRDELDLAKTQLTFANRRPQLQEFLVAA